MAPTRAEASRRRTTGPYSGHRAHTSDSSPTAPGQDKPEDRNKRERIRVGKIKVAFESLRQCVPRKPNEKPSYLKILRAATDRIKHLGEQVARQPPPFDAEDVQLHVDAVHVPASSFHDHVGSAGEESPSSSGQPSPLPPGGEVQPDVVFLEAAGELSPPSALALPMHVIASIYDPYP
ncbi:uncharacterized protein LOC144143333 [Haemaphysalis longicornis]